MVLFTIQYVKMDAKNLFGEGGMPLREDVLGYRNWGMNIL
jgi:hypothetical protein